MCRTGGTLYALVARIALWGLLLGAWSFGQGASVRSGAELTLTLVAASKVFAVLLERRSGAASAGTTFVVLTAAWLHAAGYPLLR